jgi:arabinan endo-1,5-alpha-L-arabinosidase
MRNKTAVLIVIALSICFFTTASGFGQENQQNTPQVVKVEGDVEYVHDPSIAKDGDTWYLFGTANGQIRDGELPIRCSQDLRVWKRCGNVFDKVPDWIKKESPATKELWAPDISYFNGEFHLYYAFSVFGKNTSGIALLTNKTLNPKSLDFHWVDHGLVLRSRLEDDFNAIDPNLVLDDKGQPWLSFGSFCRPKTPRYIPSRRASAPPTLRQIPQAFPAIGKRWRRRSSSITPTFTTSLCR